MGAIKAGESMPSQDPSLNSDIIDENPNPSPLKDASAGLFPFNGSYQTKDVDTNVTLFNVDSPNNPQSPKVYIAPRAVVTHQDSFTEYDPPESPIEAYRRRGIVLSRLKVASSPRAFVPSRTLSDKDFGSPSSVGSSMSARSPKGVVGVIDTAAPFESVKEAVSIFGGITDRKAHRMYSLERRKQEEQEQERIQDETPKYKRQSETGEVEKQRVLKELERTKRLVDDLKLNHEKAQTEEQQAKQDSELAKLRVEKLEQGIANEASVAAKTHLEVAKARHKTAVSELKSVKDKLEVINKEFDVLVEEKESALRKAEVERKLEEITAELIATKEMSCNQDIVQWEKELKIIEDETENQKIHSAIASAKKELEEVKLKIQKSNSEVGSLKVIQSKLEREKSDLSEKKQIEGTSSAKEADETKLVEETARDELRKAKKEAEQRKAKLSTLEGELAAAKKEIEEARASERLALSAITALQESETSQKTESMKSPKNVLLSLQEYYELIKRAHEADEQANCKVAAAKSQIETAKENEARILKKLEEVNREMTLRNEELKIMTEKANKATKGKLGMERELRRWREEHEQHRKKMSATDGSNQTTNGTVPVVHGNREFAEYERNPLTEVKKKKLSLLPKIFMYLSRKKSHK